MTQFEKGDLENLEKLCAIKLTKAEEKEFLSNLQKILDYIDQLDSFDTTSVLPCAYVNTDLRQNVFRKDEIKNTLSREDFLSNSPEQIGGMIRVPPVIK